MKRVLLCILMMIVVVFAVSSCQKATEALKPSFDVTLPDFNVVIPAVPFVVPGEFEFPPLAASFNLDSLVKANTGGAFGASSVTSVKVKKVTLTATNADQNNNLSNFESARFALSSNTNSTPVDIASFTFPETYTTSVTTESANSPELLPYLQGTQLTYHTYGKGRRTTSKELNLAISIILSTR